VDVVRNRLGMTPKSSALRRPLHFTSSGHSQHFSNNHIHGDHQPINSRLRPLAPSISHEITLTQISPASKITHNAPAEESESERGLNTAGGNTAKDTTRDRTSNTIAEPNVTTRREPAE
jgi:hypothetical protein